MDRFKLRDFAFRRRVLSFKYAFKGIYLVFLSTPNVWIHIVVMGLVLIMGFTLKIAIWEWVAISIVSTIVLAAEAFNTAIENVVDIASPEYNKLAGRAKDLAAGAVLISAIGAAICGLLIFLPKLI